MFIGREKELVLLQQDYIGKAVMVYGKRRVGKTTLIQKALDNCPYQTVYFECLKGTVQENIDSLVDELVRAKILPVALSFSTLQDVFTYLNTLPQKMVVVIDEYPYLKVMNEPTTVDSVFQSIIDNRLGNIELILSGSHIGMMKDLLQEKNALYGRFAVTIKLNELNYLDTAKFYPDKTPYDKVAHYAVFGGSPFVNQALRPTATLRENIVSTILNPVSAVYLYASQLLLSDYSVKINAERIFAVIGNGKKRYSEIEDKLDVKKTGNLAKQMKPLRDLEIISQPVHCGAQSVLLGKLPSRMVYQISKRLHADDSAGIDVDNHFYVVGIKHEAALLCDEVDVNGIVVERLGHPIRVHVEAELFCHFLRLGGAIVARKLFGFFGNFRIVAVKAQKSSVLRKLRGVHSAVLCSHFKQLGVRLALDRTDILYAFYFVIGKYLAQLSRHSFGSPFFRRFKLFVCHAFRKRSVVNELRIIEGVVLHFAQPVVQVIVSLPFESVDQKFVRVLSRYTFELCQKSA